MKKFIIFLSALGLTVLTAGCTVVNITPGFSGVRGSGEIISVNIACGDFNKLTIRTAAEIYFSAGETCAVTVELHENLAEYIRADNRDGELIIYSSREMSFSGIKELPKYRISAPTLGGLRVEGVAEIAEFERITAESFDLSVLGVISGELSLDVKEFRADLSGAGEIKLTGIADKATFITSGAGSIGAFGFSVKDVHAVVSGVGDIEISCSDTLNAVVSGVGGIKYRGNPVVTETRSGVGRVVLTA